MSSAVRPNWHRVPLIAGLLLATCAALVFGRGNVGLAALPAVFTLAVYAVWKLPLRYTMFLLLLMVLTVDIPAERPAAGMWDPPLLPLGAIIFENLNKLTGVEALRISPLDLLTLSLIALVFIRSTTGQKIDRRGSVQAATCLTSVLVLSLLGICFIEAWGIAKGGDFRNSLWQVRQLIYLPMVTFLFLSALRGPADQATVGLIVIAAACWKALNGLYFYQVICRPKNIKPPQAVTHSDSLLFVAATLIILTLFYHRRTIKSWILLLGPFPLIMLGIYVNNRRIAYVALAMSLVTMYFVVPWNPFKRLVTRAFILSLPLVFIYCAVGWQSSARIFAPVQTFRSVVSSDADRSTATRDIENYNLMLTLKTNPLLGTGFGHEYLEVNRADDISSLFAQYRYIPHNSLLGLWAFGGWVGFTCFWSSLAVGMFLAVRSYPLVKNAVNGSAVLSSIGMLVTYAIQAYGDMGLQSGMGTFLLATTLAVIGKLAVAVGAWPVRMKKGFDALAPTNSPSAGIPGRAS